MTKAQFRKLLQAVLARSVRAGPSLSLEARSVLLAMLQRGADGEPAGSVAKLAASLGVPEKSARRALGELEKRAFAYRDLDPEDGRRTVFVVNVGVVRSWAAGNHEPEWLALEGCGDDGESWDETEVRADNGVNLKAVRADNGVNLDEVDGRFGHESRVRASTSSSSSFSSAPLPGNESQFSRLQQAAMPATSQEAHAEHEAMVAALRRWGIPTPAGAQQYAWNWVGRWTVSQVSQAAEAAWRAGAKNVQYLEAVLSSDAAEAAYPVHSKVRRFEDFRGLRPWHGGPNPETAPMGAQDEVN